jgi:acyl carrier protein
MTIPHITKEQIKQLILERKLFASIAGDIDYHTEFVLDSLSLLWLIDGLEEKFDIQFPVDELDYNKLYSVNAIYEVVYLVSQRP